MKSFRQRQRQAQQAGVPGTAHASPPHSPSHLPLSAVFPWLLPRPDSSAILGDWGVVGELLDGPWARPSPKRAFLSCFHYIF